MRTDIFSLESIGLLDCSRGSRSNVHIRGGYYTLTGTPLQITEMGSPTDFDVLNIAVSFCHTGSCRNVSLCTSQLKQTTE